MRRARWDDTYASGTLAEPVLLRESSGKPIWSEALLAMLPPVMVERGVDLCVTLQALHVFVEIETRTALTLLGGFPLHVLDRNIDFLADAKSCYALYRIQLTEASGPSQPHRRVLHHVDLRTFSSCLSVYRMSCCAVSAFMLPAHG